MLTENSTSIFMFQSFIVFSNSGATLELFFVIIIAYVLLCVIVLHMLNRFFISTFIFQQLYTLSPSGYYYSDFMGHRATNGKNGT